MHLLLTVIRRTEEALACWLFAEFAASGVLLELRNYSARPLGHLHLLRELLLGPQKIPALLRAGRRGFALLMDLGSTDRCRQW